MSACLPNKERFNKARNMEQPSTNSRKTLQGKW